MKQRKSTTIKHQFEMENERKTAKKFSLIRKINENNLFDLYIDLSFELKWKNMNH